MVVHTSSGVLVAMSIKITSEFDSTYVIFPKASMRRLCGSGTQKTPGWLTYKVLSEVGWLMPREAATDERSDDVRTGLSERYS